MSGLASMVVTGAALVRGAAPSATQVPEKLDWRDEGAWQRDTLVRAPPVCRKATRVTGFGSKTANDRREFVPFGREAGHRL
jgi:hypothetical protein